MRYLTLIRHAKSSWSNPQLSDIERPLNERGLIAAPLMAKKVKEKTIIPDLILISPAKRTFDTAQYFAREQSIKTNRIKVEPIIYYGDTSSIIQYIGKIDKINKHVWLFGHEPILSEIVLYYTGNMLLKFPTAGIFQIEFSANNWSEIKKGDGKIRFSMIPKDFMPQKP